MFEQAPAGSAAPDSPRAGRRPEPTTASLRATRTSGCGTRTTPRSSPTSRPRTPTPRPRPASSSELSDAVFSEIKARTQETDLERAVLRHPPRADVGLLVLRPHRRGLGVPDLLPGGRPPTDAPRPTRSRHDRGRGGAAGRQRRGRGARVLLHRRLQRLPRRHACSPTPSTPPAPSGSRCGSRDLTTGELLPDEIDRHRVRRGLGRQQPPLLHPRRRGLAAVRGAPPPARHRRRRRRRGAHRARRAVLDRRRLQPRRPLDRHRRRQQADLGVPAAQHRRPRGRRRGWSPPAARASSTTSNPPATGC